MAAFRSVLNSTNFEEYVSVQEKHEGTDDHDWKSNSRNLETRNSIQPAQILRQFNRSILLLVLTPRSEGQRAITSESQVCCKN